MNLFLILVVVTGCSASLAEYLSRKYDAAPNQVSAENNGTRSFVESIQRSNMTAVHEKLRLYREKKIKSVMVQARPVMGENETEQKVKRRRDKVRTKGDSLHEINTNANLTDFMYQADILLTEEQADNLLFPNNNVTRVKRQAYKDIFYPSTIWDGTVYYYFDKTATSAVRRVFKKAVAFWRGNTCIKFKKSNIALNRIKVFKGQGCYSYIGRVGGIQELSLGDGCETVGTAAHELGHALGFFHSQSRYDRDEAITVKYQNIMTEYVDQFDKQSSFTNDNYGMPYDYGSIMQYGGHSASKNDEPTMTTNDEVYQDTMGSDIVGFYDVSMMNEHYKCKEVCPPSTSAKCKNGGFPKPRSCGKCICPAGYGGKLCNSRPKGCGAILNATYSFQTLQDVVGDGKPKVRQNFKKCHYLIKAPVGETIELRLKSFSGLHLDGCIYGGIEIKSQEDQKLTGYRFCSSFDSGSNLTSSSNVVPVITFNKYMFTRTILEYRIVGEDPVDETTSSTTDSYFSTTAPIEMAKQERTGTAVCTNTRTQCDLYYEQGFCENRDVRRLCKKSCGVC